MSTTRIQVSFNSILYPIDVPISTALSKTRQLFIETTEQGFVLASEHEEGLKYTFTYTPRHHLPLWEVVGLKNTNSRSSIKESNLASMWITLSSDEQWLVYGLTVTIVSLAICCLAAISLWFSMDYQSFSNRDLKILTASSFALTWLGLLFVYDTSNAISETSSCLIYNLISVVNSLESCQEKPVDTFEDESDVEESQDHSCETDQVCTVYEKPKKNQTQLQEIQQQIRNFLPNPPSKNSFIPEYQQITPQPPSLPLHKDAQNPPPLPPEQQAKNEEWNQLLQSGLDAASSRLNRSYNNSHPYRNSTPPESPTSKKPDPSQQKTKL